MTSNRSLSDESTGTNKAMRSVSGDIDAGWPSVKPNLDQARVNNTPSRSPLEIQRISEDRLYQQSSAVQNPSSIAIKQQCKALCSCSCHTRNSFQSPLILGSIIGRINVLYTGRRSLCNEFHCRRSSESSFKVFYQFPKSIMSRYISMVMHCSSSSGPKFLLRVPRMVPWSHLLWKYAVNGDPLAIQKLFAEGKASPYDLNPIGSSGCFASVGLRVSESH